MPTIDMTAVKAAAQAKYEEGVTKELTKKFTVIAKRQSQVDAYVASFNKRIEDFNTAIDAATTPAQIMEVIEAHKFPASSLAFNPKQED